MSFISFDPLEKKKIKIIKDIDINDLIKIIVKLTNTVILFSDEKIEKISIFNNLSHTSKKNKILKDSLVILQNNKGVNITINAQKYLIELEKINIITSDPVIQDNNKISPIQLSKKNIIIPKIINQIKEFILKNEEENIIENLKKFCLLTSDSGLISLYINFDKTTKKLYSIHFFLIAVIKKYFESFILKNKYNSHDKINITISLSTMDKQKLGSTKIIKFNEDFNGIILPTETIITLNRYKVRKDPLDPLNLDLIMVLFHEIIHCYGFGYWNINTYKNYKKNYSFEKEKSLFQANDVLIGDEIIYAYNKIFNCKDIIACPVKDESHLSFENRLITKDGIPYQIIPSLNSEIMSFQKNKKNLLTQVTASILSSIGYKLDFSLCDEYISDSLDEETEIKYQDITKNHFYYGFNNKMIVLTNKNFYFTGDTIFSINVGNIYNIKNNYEWQIFIMKNLIRDEKNICSAEEGVYYNKDNIKIIPNKNTPNIIYLVSSRTFAGVTLLKIDENINKNKSIQDIFCDLLHKNITIF